LKTAAKPLQTWLLLTVYRKSPAPYRTVPLPTPYDLLLNKNTSVTNGQTDDTSCRRRPTA